MDRERIEKSRQANRPVAQYGIAYLDRALTGIMPQDLVLIGADPGCGKSEIAYHIAWHNAEKMKVHLFALESDINEPMHRHIYKKISHAYYGDGERERQSISYRRYITGEMDITPYVDAVLKDIEKAKNNLTVHYRDECADIEDFQIALHQIEKGSLVILDHIDYLDLDDKEGEVKQMTQIMKYMRELNKNLKIPLVVVSHMRKRMHKNQIVPDQEDFYGSSNKPKVAKTVIIVSPDFDKLDYPNMRYGTIFRISKSRIGFPRNLLGHVVFDAKRNAYEDVFTLSRVNQYGTTITMLDAKDYPEWARAASEEPENKYPIELEDNSWR